MRILVTGAGGFIGGHLVKRLLDEGHEVRAVDIKSQVQWWQHDTHADNWGARDLRHRWACVDAVADMEHVYNLAADMGGIGYIENNKAACMLSVLINTHLLQAAVKAGVKRYFYSSSACVYAADKQDGADVVALKESDAYPAMPEDGYGWEKLFSERMCRHFREDYGLETRVARFHNVYGPKGSWNDGREKAPAAICRKVAEAKYHGWPGIDVWGDGKQMRSYMYIGDCVDGIQYIMGNDVQYPINLGSSECVSVNKLIDVVSEIADYRVDCSYDLTAPQGVRGRSSDNTNIQAELGWQPSTALAVGLESTYEWIEGRVRAGTAKQEAKS